MNLQKRVRQFFASQTPLGPGDRLVAAVSGGPDSLCLLHVLAGWAQTGRVGLFVAHLDHGLRPEAPSDADYVIAQAQILGLPAHLDRVDTRAYAATHRLSTEEAARTLRYAFLARVARSVGAQHIAVAHTRDDQAETVLMHFLRGSGLAGLKGMLPVSSLGVWLSEPGAGRPETDPRPAPPDELILLRPLLTTSRSEVEAYCLANGLQPRRDESNLDRRFLRNRLRHDLLPLLEQYNPRLREVLARSAEVLAGDHSLVQAHLDSLWPRAAPAGLQLAGRVSFDRTVWSTLSVAEQRGLLRKAVHKLRHGLRDVDFKPLDAAVRFSREAEPGRSCDVMAGLRLSINADAVTLQPWQAAAGSVPGHGANAPVVPLLDVMGRLEDGWQFSVEPVDDAEWTPGQPAPRAASVWDEYVDAEMLTEPLRLRPRRPGDRFRPLGLSSHSAKVADFMLNCKIPPALRDRWPLVLCGDAIVWLAGLRLDDRFQVRADTRHVVRLRFLRAEPH